MAGRYSVWLSALTSLRLRQAASCRRDLGRATSNTRFLRAHALSCEVFDISRLPVEDREHGRVVLLALDVFDTLAHVGHDEGSAAPHAAGCIGKLVHPGGHLDAQGAECAANRRVILGNQRLDPLEA